MKNLTVLKISIILCNIILYLFLEKINKNQHILRLIK
jgi:hypothetical protein